MLVKLISAAIQGIGAVPIYIEVHVSRGIRFSLVGLPDNAVKESHERILSALQMNGMDIPRKQVVINMAPSDLRKEGSAYDLPLAVGIMAAGEYLPAEALENSIFIGELSLDGSLNPVRGALPIAVMARDMGVRRLILPAENAQEAAIVNEVEVWGFQHIKEIRDFFKGGKTHNPYHVKHTPSAEEAVHSEMDFMDVKGQETVKRAIEVACAGGHNLIMIGPPGAGKTMMAKCIPSILPPMSLEEAIETTKIHSVAKKMGTQSLVRSRPFRAPHHSISSVALIGGGGHPQPGEISLAHNGVLFLDEMPEFQHSVLEVLRQPLEERKIRIARAKYAIEYPADFILIASMNPCPCGYYNHPEKECVCSPGQVQKYLNRISGPLMDRIDLHVEIVPVPFDRLHGSSQAESSEKIRERVSAARAVQTARFQGIDGLFCNAQMNTRQIHAFAQCDKAGNDLLKNAMERLRLSARAYHRILKVARTIADLRCSASIQAQDIAEAIQYRTLDRESWGQ